MPALGAHVTEACTIWDVAILAILILFRTTILGYNYIITITTLHSLQKLNFKNHTKIFLRCSIHETYNFNLHTANILLSTLFSQEILSYKKLLFMIK